MLEAQDVDDDYTDGAATKPLVRPHVKFNVPLGESSLQYYLVVSSDCTAITKDNLPLLMALSTLMAGSLGGNHQTTPSVLHFYF